MKIKTWACAGAAAVALAACGGGGDDHTTDNVPPVASQSIDGYITYLKALVAVQDDTISPVDVSNVTPPTDETSSPVAVN